MQIQHSVFSSVKSSAVAVVCDADETLGANNEAGEFGSSLTAEDWPAGISG